jgi:hypothetical protein
MKSIKKIQLEIFSDKEQQFYLSLLKYKLSEEHDAEALKSMADAIHFDKETFNSSFKLSEVQEKIIADKLHQIHTYLLHCKKDSADYFTVSKENFEKFKASEFGKALDTIFFTLEINKPLKGKEKNAEIKARTAMITWFFGGLMQGVKSSIENSLGNALNTGVVLKQMQNQPFSVKPNKKGNLVFESEHDTIEMELYIESGKQIRRKEIYSEEDMDFDSSSVFLLFDSIMIQIKELADDFEVSRYKNFKVKNRKIDLSEAKIIETTTMSKEKAQSANATFQKADPIVYNYEEILKEQEQNKANPDEKGTAQSEESIFAMLDENFTSLLKLPKDNPERIKARGKMIIGLFEILKEHYPDLTKHTSAIITGYIGSRMELLDTEDEYKTSGRTQLYRKYLKDAVSNILISHAII